MRIGERYSDRRIGKDQELILRFLALVWNGGAYRAPMRKFLNDFMRTNRHLDGETAREFADSFKRACRIVVTSLAEKPFRPVRALNVAVFDSVMVAIARLSHIEEAALQERYEALLADGEYIRAVSKSTADENNVAKRIELATAYLSQ